jgi:hypothetical protein
MLLFVTVVKSVDSQYMEFNCPINYTKYCHLIRRVFDWMIGFIDTLYTVLGTTGNYSAIADLNTHFTVHLYTRIEFSVFTSRILATDFVTLCLFKSPMKSSFHSLIPFLSSFSAEFNSCAPKLKFRQAGVSKLDSILCCSTIFL